MNILKFTTILFITSSLFLTAPLAKAEFHVCQSEVQAFDPANPQKQIGTFAANTMLEITGPATADGMVPVSFKTPKGDVINALCKKDDIYKTASTAVAEKSAEETKTDTSKWIDDYDKALQIAKAEKKHVLLDFTGSDWCGWCMKLEEEVFSKSEFKNFAKENLVLVTVDFPHKKKLSAKVKSQNDSLSSKFNIEGYPTIILLDATGRKVGETGYQDGGPVKYVAHLKKLLHLK